MKKLKSKAEVDGVKLSNTQVKIMQLLLDRDSECFFQRLIARNLKIPETTTKGNIERLEKMGLVRIQGKNPRFVNSTRKGKKIASEILDGYCENLKFRCHNYHLIAQFIKKPASWVFPKPKFKAVSDELRMTHWREQREGRWNDNFFLISDSSISLRIKKDIIVSDPIVGTFQALDVFLEFAKDMESFNPGLKIGKPYEGCVVIISKQEYAVRLPSFREFASPIKDMLFHVDWSKGKPEIDFFELDSANKFKDFINLLLRGEINPELLRSEHLSKIHRL